MMKQTLCALALAAATLSAQAASVTVENFNPSASGNIVGDLTAKGFVLRNDSANPGPDSFFQGVDLGATGQGGSGGYLEANYNAATSGLINEWLITPLFSTTTGGSVSVYLLGANDPGFFDTVSFGFSNGSTASSAFTLSAPMLVPTTNWTQFTLNFAGTGVGGSKGRFAINYNSDSATADAIGIDSLAISVPEPTTTMMLGLGFAGLVAARRRKSAQAAI